MQPCHIIVPFLFVASYVNCEVFTALTDLEDLLDTERVLIGTLENYIRAEDKKIGLLKRFADVFQKKHNIAIEDVELYVSNPINAYTLVKRLTTDWRHVEELMASVITHDYLANITYFKETMKFPTEEDLNGAAVALTRLQDTYRLDTSSLARGELNGIKFNAELSAADCFELGRQNFNNGDYHHTQLWMREAESRLKREANETVDRSDILEYLAFSTYKQGNILLALDLTNELLEILPTHPRASGNKVYYEEEIGRIAESQTKKVDDESESIQYEDVDSTRIQQNFYATYDTELYKSLCRGETSISEEITAKLKCRYLTNNNPFLLIAPLKVEEVYQNPNLFMFYDVMSDSEIATVKELATPRFQRATVGSPQGDELGIAPFRICKTAWLGEDEHKHIADISQRVEDMTGLTMETAEELQVVNYGIGGHYEQHYDFAMVSYNKNQK
ncbi:hypothetical protein JTB14_020587 [Gonioctena quinquepunctata]|nr:hypothetical protein JTB14_020587 [Gonioctena quinquepunctata]